MRRMQSTPLIVSSRPGCKNIATAPVNFSPIFSSADLSNVTTMPSNVGLSALSTLYGEKIGDFGGGADKTEPNEFSCWLGPRITTACKTRELDGTYVEKAEVPQKSDSTWDKENRVGSSPVKENPAKSDAAAVQLVLSDILNKQPLDKTSVVTVNSGQSSSVWLNASRDYAKEPVVGDDKDMEELHTELDKILDQLQKLVT